MRVNIYNGYRIYTGSFDIEIDVIPGALIFTNDTFYIATEVEKKKKSIDLHVKEVDYNHDHKSGAMVAETKEELFKNLINTINEQDIKKCSIRMILRDHMPHAYIDAYGG